MRATLILLAGACALAAPALAEERPVGKEPAACDASCIAWVFPGRFEEALARAKDERRILVVKGVSFGIDALGATCATKGRW